MGLFKKNIVKIVVKRFYSDYPETPFVSPDRQEKWIEQAVMFPAVSLVQKQMMKRYADNLLPGHVYMLYWLKRYTNKKVPSYFEYKYGIDFEKEKRFLYDNGFLNEMNKPTEKGEAALKRHAKVIENHTPPKPDPEKQILAQRDSFIRDGVTQYTFIANSSCCEICAKLNGKHFPVSSLEIGVNAPPMHDKCRCSIAGYEEFADYEEWLDYLANGGTTEEYIAMKENRFIK